MTTLSGESRRDRQNLGYAIRLTECLGVQIDRRVLELRLHFEMYERVLGSEGVLSSSFRDI